MDPAIQALVNIEGILELVLSYLPLVELIPKSRVCHCWNRTVHKVLQKRSRSYAIDSQVLTCSRNNDFDEDNFGDASRRQGGNKRLKLAERDDCQFFEIQRSFLKWRSQWSQAPKIIILFCKSVKATGDGFLKMSKMIFDLFQKYAPKNCAIIMLRGSMCCRFNELNFTLRTEALSFLSSRSSRVNVLTWTSLRTERAKKRLLAAIKEFSLCQSDVKILLFFYDISKVAIGNWISNTFVGFLKKDLNLGDDVVILGCAVHDNAGFLHSRNCSNKMISLMENQFQCDKIERIHNVDGGQFFAVAINGSSISSTSLLVDANVKTISEVATKMKILKRSLPPLKKDNSFGVIVSCIDRMHDAFWYDDYEHATDNIEIMALRNEFPELPILTMHSFGEIGSNFNLIDSDANPCKQLLHAGAAIFSVVHFDG